MNVQINIKREEKGNPRRGYFNDDTTITFLYEQEKGPRYTTEKEMEIVELLSSKRFSMWWTVTSHTTEGTTSTYVVNHGFDSGD